VTWTNRDDVPHTVVSVKKLFKSPPLDTEETFSTRSTRPARSSITVLLHPRMTGTIVVK